MDADVYRMERAQVFANGATAILIQFNAIFCL